MYFFFMIGMYLIVILILFYKLFITYIVIIKNYSQINLQK